MHLYPVHNLAGRLIVLMHRNLTANFINILYIILGPNLQLNGQVVY